MAGQGVPGDPAAPAVEGLVRALAAAVLGHSQGQDKGNGFQLAENRVRWGIRSSGLFGVAEEGEKMFGKLDMSVLGELLPTLVHFWPPGDITLLFLELQVLTPSAKMFWPVQLHF